jgi:hypothetical protein
VERIVESFCLLFLFANHVPTKRTTGYSPYELVFGQQAVLPIDLEMKSYLGIYWQEVEDTAHLLVAQSQQLELSEETEGIAYQKMIKACEESVQYWEDNKSD